MPQPKLWNLETGTLEDVPDFEVRQRIISGDYKWDSTTSNPMPIFSEDRTQIKYLDANIAADKAREYFQAGWDFANEAQLAEFRKEGMVPEEASIWDAMALGGSQGRQSLEMWLPELLSMELLRASGTPEETGLQPIF